MASYGSASWMLEVGKPAQIWLQAAVRGDPEFKRRFFDDCLEDHNFLSFFNRRYIFIHVCFSIVIR